MKDIDSRKSADQFVSVVSGSVDRAAATDH